MNNIKDNLQEKGKKHIIMSTANFTIDETQTKAFEELQCSPSLMGGLRQESESFAIVNTLIPVCLGNIVILVALSQRIFPSSAV